MPGCSRGSALRIALAVLLALGAAGCGERARKGWSPTKVAREYFERVRDGAVSKARDLCYFEDGRAEKVWVQQMAGYREWRKARAPAWWGQPFGEQVIRDKHSHQLVAFMEVQWLYQVRDGWMMGRHYTYRMLHVGDEWRMWISTYDPKRGVPFVPDRLPSSDDE